MKLLILTPVLILTSMSAFALQDCTSEVARELSVLAPASGEIKITGKYTKKSKSGEYKDCSLSLKVLGDDLVPSFTNESFDPSYGDGGAFWPFGSYPTKEKPSDQYRKLRSYRCSVDGNGFGIDYTYREKGGWRNSSRYTLALTKNNDGSFSASLRAGNGSVNSNLVTCKGTLSEVLK